MPRESPPYEFRVIAYPCITNHRITSHGSFSTAACYWCETDTELMGWEDRANEVRSHVDWWDSPWVCAAWSAGLGPEEVDDWD